MICYSVYYSYEKDGVKWEHHALVDAKSIKYARNKLSRKHKVDKVTIVKWSVVGYY